jgi:hypothetical protein
VTAIYAEMLDPTQISINSKYDENLIALLKHAVPHWHRKWDKENKTWLINSEVEATSFLKKAKAFGHVVTIGPRWKAELKNRRQATGTATGTATPDRVIGQLFELVDATRHDLLHKQLTKVFHPDLGGDTALMTVLNRVRDERAGRNVRTGARR